MKYSPSDDELSAFLNEVSGVKPIEQDKIQPQPLLSKKKKAFSGNETKQAQAEFFFSDVYRAHLPEEGPIRWIQEGQDSHQLKQLRRGDFHPDLLLDLHGLTKESAKAEIAALFLAARKQHIDCVCIMHGIGTHVLKQSVPHWLVQHPHVIAFHQAPLEWGGKSALLVLLQV